MPVRFQVDGDFYDHPKAIGMSDAATALWVRAGSYSTAKLSDGFVAEQALSLLSRCPDEAAGELVTRGLWRKVKGGYRFHQWDHRNLSRARVEADRRADRDRKREGRKTAGQNASPQVNTGIVRVESTPDSARSPDGIHPLSVSVSESVSGSGRGSPPSTNGTAPPGPEPPNRCPEHQHHPGKPPPCGACADARKAADRWQADRRARLAAAPQCDRHRGQPAHNCALCRAETIEVSA